uniref:Uncharacterized protein n=1 Tax=Romanomermis culicivorax TaxID=13658 RepID=A0A915L2G9_ROMCU
METARSLQRCRTQPIRKLFGSTHFHYDFVELGPVEIQIDRADSEIGRRLFSISSSGGDSSCYNLTSSSGRTSHHHNSDKGVDNKNDPSFTIFVHSNNNSWSFSRKLTEFVSFDRQLHRCVYDRRFSKLPELFSTDEKENRNVTIQTIVNDLSAYFKRFSDLAGSLITCFPVLKWLELDSRGNHLFAAEETPINTPALASAYVVRNYTAQNYNEICLNIGDIVSIIDMPDPSESFWWRGKLTIGQRCHTSSVDDISSSVSCEVGFFPSECVQLFGNRIETLPLALRSREYDKPVFQRRKNFVSLFKNFLLTRPPRRRLKESGILMERVFGCDLAEHLINAGRDVPEILKFCSSFIEQQGIVDGIYRLSGAASNIQRVMACKSMKS